MWALNPQSRHLTIVGRFDNLPLFQCFWFYFILIFLGNVLVDVIFINNTLFIFLLNLLKSFAILFQSNVTTWNHMHLFYFIFNQTIHLYFILISFPHKCIHSKKVLFVKKFLLSLNLGIWIWSFYLIFLGCYKPSPLKLNLVPRFEKNWVLREIGWFCL